jgi:hypothetical protein
MSALTSVSAAPVWSAGALAALFVVCCVIALRRAGRDGVAGGLAGAALILIGMGLAWLYLETAARQDLLAERRALEQRVSALGARAVAPGSALACLDAMAGDTVEGACERTLFATPEAMAAAVSYVAAQWTLFADISAFARRGHAGLERPLADLRRAMESDRYGLVAHVLATREVCTANLCPAVVLLRDPARVNANLSQQTYDLYVARHSAGWPAHATGPTAEGASSAIPSVTPALSPAPAAVAHPRPPGPDVFFPSAASIPPVNIMTAEPETTGSATQRPPAHRSPLPAPAHPKQAAPTSPPMDLNAAVRGAPPAPPAK